MVFNRSAVFSSLLTHRKNLTIILRFRLKRSVNTCNVLTVKGSILKLPLFLFLRLGPYREYFRRFSYISFCYVGTEVDEFVILIVVYIYIF